MNVNVEYCDPFNGLEDGFWMKVEHCGRYMWAAQWLKERRCKSAADIACANGYGSRILSRMIGRVTAVDRNEDYLNKAEHDDSVQYICCDLDREPLPEEINDTDAIVCFETLEHLQKPEAAVQAFFERLSDGGYLLLSVPNARYELLDDEGKNKDPFHLHIFSPDTVRAFWRMQVLLSRKLWGRIYAIGSWQDSLSWRRLGKYVKVRRRNSGDMIGRG